MVYVRSCILLVLISYTKGQIHVTDGAIRINSFETGNYIVEENQPLSVYFDKFSVTRGWCYDYYYHAAILETARPPRVNNSCIQFSNVTKNMSTLLECTVEVKTLMGRIIPLKPQKQLQSLKLKLHVKGAKRINMIINGRHMEFAYNNISDPYDGFARYIYQENESINATCLNIENMGTVQLFYAKTGIKSKAVFNSTLLTINLHVGLNNSYLDCEYISEKPEDKYAYRVYFVSEYKPYSQRGSFGSFLGVNINILHIILGCFSGLILITGIICWYKKLRSVKDIETSYKDLIEENTITPTLETNNDGEKNLEYSEPYYHSYEVVNYLQCKPKPTENQQRSSKIYDSPYEHSIRYFNRK